MLLTTSLPEVIKHILSFLSSKDRYRLHYTAKTLRKHLAKVRLTYRIKSEVLGLFSLTTVDFNSAMVKGLARRWQGMSAEEKREFAAWIKGMGLFPYTVAICLSDIGMMFVSYQCRLLVPHPLAPYPRWKMGRYVLRID